MSEATLEALRIEIEDAHSRFPKMRINWEEWDDPPEHYSEATVERAVAFLRELVEHSIREGDPIDVPEVCPSSGGDLTLDGDFESYSFLFRIPVDPNRSVIYSGREKHGALHTCGTIQLGDVGKAFDLWQGIRRGECRFPRRPVK